MMEQWEVTWWWPYIHNILLLLMAVGIGCLLGFLLLRMLTYTHGLLPPNLVRPLAPRLRLPLTLLLVLIALQAVLPLLTLHEPWITRFGRVLQPLLIITLGWMLIRVARTVGDFITERNAWSAQKDNLRARRITTQVHLVTRVVIFAIAVFSAIGVAMAIPGLKTLGLSLFASAGLAGIVIGMAARPALGNLLAGLQLAFSQPIRIDDVVIVEGEWGRIEEISNSYVVVRIWDKRQLIVPLTYFIEKPFQNWTHTTTNLIGTVFLYVDYTLPLEPLRAELDRIIHATPLWDGQVCALQVTEAKESNLELRILISGDGTTLFDLRCYVREHLIDFLQREYPRYLPQVRANSLNKNEEGKEAVIPAVEDAVADM